MLMFMYKNIQTTANYCLTTKYHAAVSESVKAICLEIHCGQRVCCFPHHT